MPVVASIIAITFALGLIAQTVMADQSDPRLSELFQQLHDVDSVEDSIPIQNMIWEIWTQSDSDTVDLLMEKGLGALQQRNFDIALTMFNSIVEIKPDFAEGWNKRATLYYLMGRHEESLKDIDRVIQLEPRHFGALSGAGLVNMALKRPEDALKAFKRALDANPHMPSTQARVMLLKQFIEGRKI
tara:strand:+ start:465 stop:1022 length:558 start_codon:yes stop_codon:yes gene_type:complete